MPTNPSLTLAIASMILCHAAVASAQQRDQNSFEVTLNRGPSAAVERVQERGQGDRQDLWVSSVSDSTLRVFLPAGGAKPTAAVVICPGGGYGGLAYSKEGTHVAEWFAERGVAAGVLKYRFGTANRHPAPLDDAQSALRYLRFRAGELGYPADKVGVMGFSAGGHLAATAATQFTQPTADEGVTSVTSRPDFAVLGYPVITMGEATHRGSRGNLLGRVSDEEAAKLSAEANATKGTPPTFIFHSQDDNVVPVANALLFFGACTREGVPVEMHIFERGGHGYGMWSDDRPVHAWPSLLEAWMKDRGLMTP